MRRPAEGSFGTFEYEGADRARHSRPLQPRSRFNGPARSANGGYAAGAVAALLCGEAGEAAGSWPAVTVVLRQPPPLDVAMAVEREGDALVVSNETGPVARATRADHEPPTVAAVDPDTARAAESAYQGLTSHPFPTCVGCGTAREPGDGLRVFPGEVEPAADGSRRLAATWTPHPSLAEDWHDYRDSTREASVAATWCALDCIGGWSGDMGERHLVLGTMTARVHALPVIGAEHVVVGQMRGAEGRKVMTAASLYGPDGGLVATGEHVWLTIDPRDFN